MFIIILVVPLTTIIFNFNTNFYIVVQISSRWDDIKTQIQLIFAKILTQFVEKEWSNYRYITLGNKFLLFLSKNKKN